MKFKSKKVDAFSTIKLPVKLPKELHFTVRSCRCIRFRNVQHAYV